MGINEVFLYEIDDDFDQRTDPPIPVKQKKEFSDWAIDQTFVLPNDSNDQDQARWEQIKTSLQTSHATIDDWIQAICSYTDLKIEFFDNLRNVFIQDLNETEAQEYLDNVLPKMAELATQLPNLLPISFPILSQNVNRCIHMTQQQVACLLANGFFCTFKFRENPRESKLPNCNFFPLFKVSAKRNQCQPIKIRILLNYFKRVTTNMPTGTISYYRRSLKPDQVPDWNKPIDVRSLSVQILPEQSIETCPDAKLHVDFANKRVGGSVLGNGCVQEEIRFIVWPELIIGRLFTEILTDNDVLFVTGAEQFASYSGYKEEFKFVSDFVDERERDALKRKDICIVALDAVNYRGSLNQFTDSCMLRELNKAYCGFAKQSQIDMITQRSSILVDNCAEHSPVATGNWGCGAYMGDDEFKFTIQLLAAIHSQRPMKFNVYDSSDLGDRLQRFLDQINENNVNGMQLFKMLTDYNVHVQQKKKKRDRMFALYFNIRTNHK